MRNKFKLKKKLVSIALALVLAAQPLASLPMNVFAGTGKNGMLTAPLKADLKELNYGQQVTSKYIVQKSVDFSDKKVLSARIVQGPGIVYAKEKVGNLMRDVYIIVDINGMLQVARGAANAAYKVAKAAYKAAKAAGKATNKAAKATYKAAKAAAKAAYSAYSAYSVKAAAAKAAVANSAAKAAAKAAPKAAAKAAAKAAQNADDAYNAWAGVYKTKVDGVVSDIVEKYKAATDEEQLKKDWLGAAYAAVKAAKKMSDGNGLDLEAKLKIAYMAYRIAEAVWIQLDNNPTQLEKCKKNADALQEVIDRMYSDKVGDIAEQAVKA